MEKVEKASKIEKARSDNKLPVPDVEPILVNFSSGENRPAKKDER
jgi:hypothetical protein